MPPGHASASSWNLHRVFVMVALVANVLAILAHFRFDFMTLVAGLPEVAPALPGVVFGIVLAYFARPWVYLTAGLLNAILPLMVLFVFGALATLGSPGAGSDYQSSLLLAVGLVFSLWGGIAGFVATRKGDAIPLRQSPATRSGMAAMAAIALVLGASFSGFAASEQMRAATGAAFDVVPDETVTVVMKDFMFAPREVTIPAGKLVELVIDNQDSTMHTFTYTANGRDVDVTLVGGVKTSVLVKIDTPQTIPFWCTPHSGGADDDGEGMVGTVIVA